MAFETRKMKCPFCEINVEITRVVKDGRLARVILSNPRRMPNHLLVTPKRHVEKISELEKEELGEIFELLIEFEEKLLESGAGGCDIRQHYRPFIKDGESRTKVGHLHFHLQPRELNDQLFLKSQSLQDDLWEDLTEEEIERSLRLLG